MTAWAKKIGQWYEQQACDFLIKQDYQIITTNWVAPRVGELDIVAYHDKIQNGCHYPTLVCIEVKARRKNHISSAIETVTKAKQKRLIHTMQYFLQSHTEYAKMDIRFDVLAFEIGVDGQINIDWVQGAFLADIA